jgi:hypothetical protein
MEDQGVIVLVLVELSAMLELAEHAAGVMMGDVIVVVRVDDWRMDMLVLSVPDDALDGLCLCHGRTSLWVSVRISDTAVRGDQNVAMEGVAESCQGSGQAKQRGRRTHPRMGRTVCSATSPVDRCLIRCALSEQRE